MLIGRPSTQEFWQGLRWAVGAQEAAWLRTAQLQLNIPFERHLVQTIANAPGGMSETRTEPLSSTLGRLREERLSRRNWPLNMGVHAYALNSPPQALLWRRWQAGSRSTGFRLSTSLDLGRVPTRAFTAGLTSSWLNYSDN